MADPVEAPSPNLNISPAQKNLVTLLHTERNMKIFGVTENELRTLTAINVGMAVAFSIGSAMIGMALDLHKDLLLVEAIPDKAKVLESHVSPALMIGAAIFYIIGIGAFIIRGGFVRTIKKETV